jgi:hypothetical protein
MEKKEFSRKGAKGAQVAVSGQLSAHSRKDPEFNYEKP